MRQHSCKCLLFLKPCDVVGKLFILLKSNMILSEAYNELAFYTLAHPDQIYFIHQHIVDAQIAQTADPSTKQISLVFALVGLYLTVEKGYTGRDVQKVHMQLTKNKSSLPAIPLPVRRGEITVADVLETKPGEERDRTITLWCVSVWEAYKGSQKTIAQYTDERLAEQMPLQ